MSTNTYTVIDTIQRNAWNDQLQQAQEGWQVRARWEATGTLLSVFVPDAAYNPTNVDAAIRQAGYKDEQVHSLGAGAVTPPPAAK
jgi:hypothetical protein